MKKSLLTLFLFLIGLTLFAQSNDWVKVLTGKIGNSPVTFYLQKRGTEIEGQYYYNSKDKPIFLSGNDTAIKESLLILAHAGANDTSVERIELKPIALAYVGTWVAGSKTLPISLTAQPDAMGWTLVYAVGEKKLRPQREGSPMAEYSAIAIWPSANNATANFVKRKINEWYGNNGPIKEVGKLMLEEKKKYFDDYWADVKEATDTDIEESSSMYNYSSDRRMRLVYQTAKFIMLTEFNYGYTGGAHGNYATRYMALDLVNKKELKLNDIITKEGQKKLSALLEKRYRADMQIPATDSLTDAGLFENTIQPNENFYFTKKGINFNFSPYEIGPYVMGEIELFIPFSELTEYMTPALKNLIKD